MYIKKKIIFSAIAIFLIAVGGYFTYSSNLLSFKKVGVASNENTSPTYDSVGNSFNSGDIDATVKVAEKFVSDKPNDANALLSLASVYAEKGSVSFSEKDFGQKAIDTANKALVISPDSSEAHRIIGYSYEIMQEYDKAIAEYNIAISLDQKNSQAYSGIGHSYDLQGDLDKAEIWYKKALAINPSNQHTLLNMSRVELRKKKYDDARVRLNNLILVTRNNRIKAEAYQLLGVLYKQSVTEAGDSKNYDLAIESLNQSKLFDPTVPQTYVALADVKITILRRSTSQVDFDARIADIWLDVNKAISINKNQAAAYYFGAKLALMNRDDVKFQEYVKKAQDAVPLDITLGALEKKGLSDVLKTMSTFKFTSN